METYVLSLPMKKYLENSGRVVFAFGLLFKSLQAVLIGYQLISINQNRQLYEVLSGITLLLELYIFLFLFYSLRWRFLLFCLFISLAYNASVFAYILGYVNSSPSIFYRIFVEISWIIVLIRLGTVYLEVTRAFFFLSAAFQTAYRTSVYVMIIFAYYNLAFSPILMGIALLGYLAEFIGFALVGFLPRTESQATA